MGGSFGGEGGEGKGGWRECECGLCSRRTVANTSSKRPSPPPPPIEPPPSPPLRRPRPPGVPNPSPFSPAFFRRMFFRSCNPTH